MTAEKEAQRMQNIIAGVGCPHGRDPEGVCIPCDQKLLAAEMEKMTSEGGLAGPPFEAFQEERGYPVTFDVNVLTEGTVLGFVSADPTKCLHFDTITSCADCGEVLNG